MHRFRTSSAPEVLLNIDLGAADALHRQVTRGLRAAIRSQRLRAGAALPSSRMLARELGVSRGVVVEAYEQLVAEGYLDARPGGSTRVRRFGGGVSVAPAATPVPEPDVDFRPGRPDVRAFPRDAWLRSLRRALAVAPAGRLGYLDGTGLPELREELASHLNRVRGTVARPDDVVITTGFAQGLGILASILRDDGARSLAVEDPSLGDARDVVGLAGLRLVPVPVDGDGLAVDRLDRLERPVRARLAGVVVTPAHQYPTGQVLSPDRRARLLDWAERRRAIVVEDDYDAEYRYDRRPLAALQGLRPDRVVYAGSASKFLAPGLRLGWFVAPAGLARRLAARKKALDQGSPALDQLAFADFLAHGELDRHLRRMRPVYRRRREALLDALRRHLPELEPVGAAAGLHVLAWLPDDRSPTAIAARAAGSGIGLGAVPAGSEAAPGGVGGLVFGFGMIDAAAIEPGVERLARVVRARPRGGRD